MKRLVTRLLVFLLVMGWPGWASAQQPSPDTPAPPTLLAQVEERLSFHARWGATLFAGAAGLYGEAPVPLERSIYPTAGAGLQFVIKPEERMNVNLEYAQGVADNRGVYLKLGYAW